MRIAQTLSVFLLAWPLLLAGCKPQVQERKYRVLYGIATEIDLETGIVFMEWKSQQTGKNKISKGRVTHETEIFIRGISAGLEDIRIGDRAIVTVYPFEGQQNEQEWVVTSVLIEREESFMLNKALPDATPEAGPSGPGES